MSKAVAGGMDVINSHGCIRSMVRVRIRRQEKAGGGQKSIFLCEMSWFGMGGMVLVVWNVRDVVGRPRE